jgi:hypothetical protein
MTDEYDEARHAGSTGAGTAEMLIRIGAAIVLADYVIFGLLMNEYFFFWGTVLFAAYALFAAWVRSNRSTASWPVSYGWTMKLIGYSVGFLGAFELVEDLRFGLLDNTAEVLGGIVLYAGAFLMFWGARQLGSTTD